MGESIGVATPGAVASAIRGALEAGWEGDGNGGPAFFGIATGRLASSMRGVSVEHSDAVTQGSQGVMPSVNLLPKLVRLGQKWLKDEDVYLRPLG